MVEMLEFREFTVDTTGCSETQARFSFHVEEALALEEKGALGVLYKSWLDADALRKPTFSIMGERIGHLPQNVQDSISIIDIRADNPMKYQIHKHGLLSNFDYLQGFCIDQFSSMLNRTAKSAEYSTVKRRGQPFVHEVHQWCEIDGAPIKQRHYLRAMFPVYDLQGRPTHIFSASRRSAVLQLRGTLMTPLMVEAS